MPYKDRATRIIRQREYRRRTFVPHPRPPLDVRFWRKVDKSGDCWLWMGTRSIGGRYGAVHVEGRMRPAHIVAYELTVGLVPAGLELDHLCRVTACVKPSHLEPVTHAENMRRGIQAQRARERMATA